MKRKWAWMIGIAALAASSCAVFAQSAFFDLTGHPAQDRIVQLANDNIVSGYADGSFRPDGHLTRAEAASLFAKLLPDTTQRSNLSDVGAQWFAAAVDKTAAYGVVKGYDDGTFRPDLNITREEFAQLVANYFAYLNLDYGPLNGYENAAVDASDIPSLWALRPVYDMALAGLMSGRGDGYFYPTEPITRAEAATMLSKVRNKEMKRFPPLAYNPNCVLVYDEFGRLVFEEEGIPQMHGAGGTKTLIGGEVIYKRINNTDLQLSIPKEAVKFEYDKYGMLRAMYDKDDKLLETEIPQDGYIKDVTDEQVQEQLSKFGVVDKDTAAYDESGNASDRMVKKGTVVYILTQKEDKVSVGLLGDAKTIGIDGAASGFALLNRSDVRFGSDVLKGTALNYVRYAVVYDRKDGTPVGIIYATSLSMVGAIEDGRVKIRYGDGQEGSIRAADLEVK